MILSAGYKILDDQIDVAWADFQGWAINELFGPVPISD